MIHESIRNNWGMWYNDYSKKMREEFANKITVVTCPQECKNVEGMFIHKFAIPVFLAGGITNCEEWQKVVIDYFQKNWNHSKGIIFLNPRRDNFDVTNPNATVEQIEWEFKYLNTHGVLFSMYFSDSQSPQPICFYEMGRALAKITYDAFGNQLGNKVFITTHKNFFRKQDVLIQSRLADENFAAIEVESAEEHAKKLMEFIEKNYTTSVPLESSVGFRCWDCKHFTHTGGHGSSDWGYCNNSKSGRDAVDSEDACNLFEKKND